MPESNNVAADSLVDGTQSYKSTQKSLRQKWQQRKHDLNCLLTSTLGFGTTASTSAIESKSDTGFDRKAKRHQDGHAPLAVDIPATSKKSKTDEFREEKRTDELDISAIPATSILPTQASHKVDGTVLAVPDSVEGLLALSSIKERETKKLSNELSELLSRPTAKDRLMTEKFRSVEGSQVKEFCPNGTKEDCIKMSSTGKPCKRLHFRKIIKDHTDISLGDCSFLNTCFHMNTCKYIHYEIDYSTLPKDKRLGEKQHLESTTKVEKPKVLESHVRIPPQWIQCDLRSFDLTVLGKFAVVMADPPWDIHMELPYGTMSDLEMRSLNIQCLQDDGVIFLWVTGRAMELGRECLKMWGYDQCDEIVWVKTNQLQRIIRTGRTGHWLNHGKEHCLVGCKGSLESFNRGLDCDVIVAEVRETSHKPDEVYGLIERLAPGGRKVELFGRMHNSQPNWVTLGNQLDGVRILDADMAARFKEKYPDGNCLPQKTGATAANKS